MKYAFTMLIPIRSRKPSVNGPIYSVGGSQMGVKPVAKQGYGWEHGAPDDNFYNTSELKPYIPAHNPQTASDTHIPLP